jgi:hypothetical protein
MSSWREAADADYRGDDLATPVGHEVIVNDELTSPGLDIIVPDITKACPMFFPWSSQPARSATRS